MRHQNLSSRARQHRHQTRHSFIFNARNGAFFGTLLFCLLLPCPQSDAIPQHSISYPPFSFLQHANLPPSIFTSAPPTSTFFNGAAQRTAIRSVLENIPCIPYPSLKHNPESDDSSASAKLLYAMRPIRARSGRAARGARVRCEISKITVCCGVVFC